MNTTIVDKSLLINWGQLSTCDPLKKKTTAGEKSLTQVFNASKQKVSTMNCQPPNSIHWALPYHCHHIPTWKQPTRCLQQTDWVLLNSSQSIVVQGKRHTYKRSSHLLYCGPYAEVVILNNDTKSMHQTSEWGALALAVLILTTPWMNALLKREMTWSLKPINQEKQHCTFFLESKRRVQSRSPGEGHKETPWG